MPQLPSGAHRFVVVAAPVADVDPAAVLGGRPHAAEAVGPQVGFAAAPLASVGGFALGGGLPDLPLLKRQAKHLPRLRQHGQAVVLQEAFAEFIADLPSAGQVMVAGVVQFGGVMQDQHQRLLAHGLTRLLPVRRLHGGRRCCRLIAQAIEPPQFIPIEDLGEGLLRVGGNPGGRLDQSPPTPRIAQVGVSESLLGPCPSVG